MPLGWVEDRHHRVITANHCYARLLGFVQAMAVRAMASKAPALANEDFEAIAGVVDTEEGRRMLANIRTYFVESEVSAESTEVRSGRGVCFWGRVQGSSARGWPGLGQAALGPGPGPGPWTGQPLPGGPAVPACTPPRRHAQTGPKIDWAELKKDVDPEFVAAHDEAIKGERLASQPWLGRAGVRWAMHGGRPPRQACLAPQPMQRALGAQGASARPRASCAGGAPLLRGLPASEVNHPLRAFSACNTAAAKPAAPPSTHAAVQV